MDKDNLNPTPSENENWLDEILGTGANVKELGPDELAVQAAGLTHPDDMELEKILSEDWDSVPSIEEATQPEPKEEFQPVTAEETQFFAPIEETQVVSIPEEKKNAAPKQKKATAKSTTEAKKTRPEAKNGYGLYGIPHIFATLIWLVIILAIGVTLGRTLWVSCADLMAFGKPDQQITVTITPQDDIDSIANKLGDADLIEYPTLFKLFATLTGKDADIEVGTFTLNSKFDYNAMINNMVNYGEPREEIDIMIPEGYTCAQIFALMEEKGVCDAARLEEYAAYGSLPDYWFLEGIRRGDKYCLEGYLFPDTYRFYTNDAPGNVIKKFLDGFDYRFTSVMEEKLQTIEERTGLKLSIHQVVIIASIIEKETAGDADSYDISSVVYNRLNNAADYPYLNMDATLIYALGGNIDPETGLTKPLTEEDMHMDHPYNTYVYRGLPPGPISNPGRNSLDAALDPNSTNYFYYVYNPYSGKHMFARSLYEQEQNIYYINSLG